jgi:hypothetical protein
VRRVRTASGAVAVQVVLKEYGEVEHVGSAHTDADPALLLAAAQERLAPGQEALDFGELAVSPARVSDTADWTRPPGSAPDTALAASAGRPRSDRAGGRVVALRC